MYAVLCAAQGRGAKGQNEYEFSLEFLLPVKTEVCVFFFGNNRPECLHLSPSFAPCESVCPGELQVHTAAGEYHGAERAAWVVGEISGAGAKTGLPDSRL